MSNEKQRQEKSTPETPEELVSLAQKYFSHDFLNSGDSCPTAEIAEQIESGELPDDSLRQHLLACSKCFVTYRERLESSREMQPVVSSLRQRISNLLCDPWARILVPSLPALLVALLAVVYFSSNNSSEQVTLVNSPIDVVNVNANTVTTATPSPAQPQPSPQVERSAPHVARVDLRDYSPQRGNEAGEEPAPIQIEKKPTVFTITLPDGSPPGTYSVSIVNAFGRPIKTRTSHSADGKRLTATLNLVNLRNQNYRLCVSRSDEPPNCYPIVITNRGK